MAQFRYNRVRTGGGSDMEPAERRSEPRFEHGGQIRVQVFRNAEWIEFEAFTVNVSENGLLITTRAKPAVGERLLVELPGHQGRWVDASVRHVVPGRANNLVGLRLHQRQDVRHATNQA